MNTGKILTTEAAAILNTSPQFVRVAMQQGKLPIGIAIKMSTKWTYNRTLSEQYGLKVDLCLECHQFGAHAVHKDQAVMDELHRLGQEAFESQIGSREQFRKIFGRNWL